MAASIYLSLLVLNYELPIEGIDYLSTHIRRLIDALIISLPILYVRRRWIVALWCALVTAFVLSNLWYYRNYGTLMPASSYLMVRNLEGLGPSVINSMRWRDLLAIFPPLLFIIWYCSAKRQLLPRKKYIWWTGGCAVIISALVISPSYILHHRTDYSHPLGLYRNEVLRAYRQFGFINYFIYQAYYASGVSDEEKQLARQWMARKSACDKNVKPLISNNPPKNLILVLVESLQSWPIGLKIDGMEVTPRLNSLVADSSVTYFPNVLPQVKGGRSADAQLLLNTGLLPINNGATASLFGTNEYLGLPKILKEHGYHSISMLCDNKAYWNQEASTKSYGFDALIDRIAHGAPVYRNDEHLFRFAADTLPGFQEPFYAQMVTMSGHDAVESDIPSPLRGKKFKSKEVEYNLIITQYVDSCIGRFIDEIRANGLLDRSVVVITGDHECITRNRYEGREKCLLSDRFVPLIIINSPLGAQDTDAVIGQGDIFPSILDMTGVGNCPYRGMGTSIFRDHPGTAIYHDGTAVGKTVGRIADELRHRWTISDILIRMNYWNEPRQELKPPA